MATLNLTKSELSVLAGITENSSKRQSVANKAMQALGYSVSTEYDKTSENFAKRIIAYIGMNNPDKVNETELTGKWLKMLAKRVSTFLKENGLEPSEGLAISLSEYTEKEFKKRNPNYKKVGQLYRGIKAFINNEYPEEDTLKGKVINALVAILYAIDGRFGNWVLKPEYRTWWRVATYGTLIVLFFIYIFIPFMDWWQGVVDYINYVRWYS